jgi:hypothetical protein
VAGIDYPVGYDSTRMLKDAATYPWVGTGCSYSPTGNTWSSIPVSPFVSSSNYSGGNITLNLVSTIYGLAPGQTIAIAGATAGSASLNGSYVILEDSTITKVVIGLLSDPGFISGTLVVPANESGPQVTCNPGSGTHSIDIESLNFGTTPGYILGSPNNPVGAHDCIQLSWSGGANNLTGSPALKINNSYFKNEPACSGPISKFHDRPALITIGSNNSHIRWPGDVVVTNNTIDVKPTVHCAVIYPTKAGDAIRVVTTGNIIFQYNVLVDSIVNPTELETGNAGPLYLTVWARYNFISNFNRSGMTHGEITHAVTPVPATISTTSPISSANWKSYVLTVIPAIPIPGIAPGETISLHGLSPAALNRNYTTQLGTTASAVVVGYESYPGAISTAGATFTINGALVTGQSYSAGQLTLNITPSIPGVSTPLIAGLQAGQWISIAGATPSSLNGYYQLQSGTTTAAAAINVVSDPGTVTAQINQLFSNRQIWNHNLIARMRDQCVGCDTAIVDITNETSGQLYQQWEIKNNTFITELVSGTNYVSGRAKASVTVTNPNSPNTPSYITVKSLTSGIVLAKGMVLGAL